MLYAFIVTFIIGGVFSYPLIYNLVIFPKEMDKFESHMKSNRTDAAIKILKSLPQKKQNTLDVQLAFSDAHAASKHWYLAIFHLNKIIDKKLYKHKSSGPLSKVRMHLKKADYYKNSQKPKEAVQEYFDVLEVNPKHPNANLYIGQQYFELKNYGAALTHLTEAYQAYPADGNLAETLSDIHVNMNFYDKALHYIELAHQSSDTPICRLQHKKIIILYYLKRYHDVIEIAREIDRTYAKFSEIEIILGIVHYHLNRLREATIFFTDNLQQYINDYSPIIMEARYLYSEILIQQFNFTDAVVQLSFIEQKNQSNSYKDTDERLSSYRKIINDDDLNNFFKSAKNPRKLTQRINELFQSHEELFLQSSFRQFDEDSYVFISRAERPPKRERVLVIFSICLLGLQHDHLKIIDNIQEEEHLMYSGSIKILYYFTMLPLEATMVGELKRKFIDIQFFTREKMFDLIKSKSLDHSVS